VRPWLVYRRVPPHEDNYALTPLSDLANVLNSRSDYRRLDARELRADAVVGDRDLLRDAASLDRPSEGAFRRQAERQAIFRSA
jgi:hypothetical protein